MEGSVGVASCSVGLLSANSFLNRKFGSHGTEERGCGLFTPLNGWELSDVWGRSTYLDLTHIGAWGGEKNWLEFGHFGISPRTAFVASLPMLQPNTWYATFFKHYLAWNEGRIWNLFH